MTSLKSLFLDNIRLTGTLPSFHDLDNLHNLLLQNNDLSGIATAILWLTVQRQRPDVTHTYVLKKKLNFLEKLEKY